MDAICIKVNRTACCLFLKMRERGRKISSIKGGLNSKLHVITDAVGRPILTWLSAGQVSDYDGAKVPLNALPKGTKVLVADFGCDVDWVRKYLKEKAKNPASQVRKTERFGRPATFKPSENAIGSRTAFPS